MSAATPMSLVDPTKEVSPASAATDTTETATDTTEAAGDTTEAAGDALSGSHGTFRWLTRGTPGIGVKIMSKKVKDKKSADHEVQNAVREFRLEALHYRAAQAYIVRAFEVKFNAQTESFSLIMEAAAGDLIEYMKDDHSKNRLQRTWWVMHDAFRGLQELWNMKIAHRDIKAENILWFKRAGDKSPAFKLGDLGAAEAFDTDYYHPYGAFHLLGTCPPPIQYWLMWNNKLQTLRIKNLGESDVDVYAMCIVFMRLMVDGYDWEKYAHGLVAERCKHNEILVTLPTEMEQVDSKKHVNLHMLHRWLIKVAELFSVPKNLKESDLFKSKMLKEINKIVLSDTARENDIMSDNDYLYTDKAVDDICALLEKARVSSRVGSRVG